MIQQKINWKERQKGKQIWRDDDIGHMTDLKKFKEVHEIFKKYKVTHTIALICKDIEKAPKLIDYIRKNDISVQIHCWDHVDFKNSALTLQEDLLNCSVAIEKHFKVAPKYVFPPWNSADETSIGIAKELDLIMEPEKISLPQYIRTKGHVKEPVINFHYWAYEHVMLLDAALNIYVNE